MALTLLVEDIGKAREATLAAAAKAGLPVLRVDPVSTPALDLHIDTAAGFVDAARHLGAKVLYLALMETDKAETAEARKHLLPMLKAGAAIDEEARVFARAVERMLDVTLEHGYPNFYAAFFHEGVLHRIHVCDRDAWPAVREFQERGGASGVVDEDDEEDEDLEWLDEARGDLDEAPAPPRAAGPRTAKRKGKH